MKVLKIDHLGIAVKQLDEGQKFWTDVLELASEGTETVEEQKVTTAFFPVGESEVELLESTAPDGPIAKYIEKRGEGIQHVAFQVADIEAALAELKEKGVRVIDEKPRRGAGSTRRSCTGIGRSIHRSRCPPPVRSAPRSWTAARTTRSWVSQCRMRCTRRSRPGSRPE